jgi:2-methylaconitate cis-trans-isomerase PrpF
MDQAPIPCVPMRGGTSKGPFFLAADLPADPARRDAMLRSDRAELREPALSR